MREYVGRFARSARKELERLDSDLIARIFSRIEALSRNPRPAGCRKLRGKQSLWRIRVGQYRIVYEVLDDAGLAIPGLAPDRYQIDLPFVIRYHHRSGHR